MKYRKLFLSLLLITLTIICFGQTEGRFSSFFNAFKHIDSVKTLSINCMHNNFYRTDGCDSIPENIEVFYNLERLSISESRIKVLPSSINKLSRLKKLSLEYLYSFNYDEELCKLVGLDSLESLKLWMGQVEELPICLLELKSLKEIDLSNNDDLNIKSAFAIFKQLPKLEILDLSGINNLTVLPLDISNLNALQTIKLNYLGSKFEFKTSFERLSSLEIDSLFISNNRLNALPSSLTKLQQITYIDLSDNNFKSIPSEIFELTNLKEIKMQHNPLSLESIGTGIKKLIYLEKINLGNNWKLDGEEAIMNLSKLPSLKNLDFFSCRLEKIPEEITQFPKLEKLNLDRNPKLDFPDLLIKLSSLKTLKYLDLSDNKLDTLPKEIGLLTSLEYLIIGENNFTTFPNEFYKLKNLKELNIYGNNNSIINEEELQKIKDKLPNCEITTKWVFRH